MSTEKKRTVEMHQGRLRLRPWLEQQIRSGNYPGVIWLDEAAQIFQIPWKHAARHGWSIDKDATLFRNWAIHTGRYRPDRDKPDPKTWKANFRCAIKSLPDVKELQDQSNKKGHNAFRVFKLLNSKVGKKTKGTFCRENSEDIAPVVCSRNSYYTIPSVKEEQSANYCCSPVTTRTLAHEVQPNGMEEHEQTEAVLKIVDNLQNMETWSLPFEHDRVWRPTNNWTEGHYEITDYPSYTDLHYRSITSQFSRDLQQVCSDPCSTLYT